MPLSGLLSSSEKRATSTPAPGPAVAAVRAEKSEAEDQHKPESSATKLAAWSSNKEMLEMQLRRKRAEQAAKLVTGVSCKCLHN